MGLLSKSATLFTQGATFSEDGTIDRDLDVRIVQRANGTFHQLWKIWNSRTIKTLAEIRIYKAAVVTILLYGAEVWDTTKKQIKRFEVFHQTSLKRILRIKFYWSTFPTKRFSG